MKLCRKCNIEKPKTKFNKKTGRKLQSFCKDCQHIYFKHYYENNKEYHKSRTKVDKKEKIKLCRKFVRDYLRSHPCVDCSEDDIVVLVFDHLRDKKLPVSKLVTGGYSLEVIKKEIEKCEVRCANCHTRKHQGQFYEI